MTDQPARPNAPAEYCGEIPPQVLADQPPGLDDECVLRPGHSGSHAAAHGMRWRLAGQPEQASPRTRGEVSAAVECAIGLNVDCGGTAGVHRVRDAVLAAIRPELDALAALRKVARGYCPACGRGDAAPTVADWEQQRKRADQAEELLSIAHDTSNRSEAERARATDRAEAAIARALEALNRSRVSWDVPVYKARDILTEHTGPASDGPAS